MFNTFFTENSTTQWISLLIVLNQIKSNQIKYSFFHKNTTTLLNTVESLNSNR